MSLFNWFKKKPPLARQMDVDSSGMGPADATVPFHASGKGQGRTAPPSVPGANRKSERLERREMLYAVVRESMIRVGVLSSSYKFKVLSLDSRGRQYLIMMDLARLHAGEIGRLTEIESLIAHSAKSRHDILVSSVYWRINEQVTTAGLSRPMPAAAAAPRPPVIPTPVPVAKAPYEPLQADEVAAFKQALASMAPPAPLSSPGQIVHSGRRNPNPQPTFEDTELDDRPTPLSGTQYGDLN